MSNPNNCPECEHHKMQRNIEQHNPNEQKLHCYMFKDEPAEVCMQHSGHKMSFFDYSPTGRLTKPHDPPIHQLPPRTNVNAPIQTMLRQMAEDLRRGGYIPDDLQ